MNAYLPNDVWYEATGDFVKLYPKTGHIKLADNPNHPPIHFRGGYILPIAYKRAVNTEILRQKPIQLEVYPKNKKAIGDLFWDDGDSIDSIPKKQYNFYTFELLPNCSVEIQVQNKGYVSKDPHIIDKILVANTLNANISAKVDNKDITGTVVSKDDYLVIPVNIDLNSGKVGQKWIISWKTSTNTCNLK